MLQPSKSNADVIIPANQEHEIEIWKEVPNYEKTYKVSNLGRLLHVKTNNITNGSFNVQGYKLFCFRRNKKNKGIRAHRIVAEVFIPNPENKPFINHINGIRTDNRVSNLEWCTPKENIRHAVDVLGNVFLKKGTITRKLSKETIIEIRKNGIKYDSAINLAKKYNINPSTFYRILNNKTYNEPHLLLTYKIDSNV